MESTEIQKAIPEKKGIPASAPEWKKWIKANIENFEGNVNNAAELMHAFNKGINYINNMLASEGHKNFERPAIEVLFDNDPDLPQIGCSLDGKDIFIKKTFLEKASNFDLNSKRTSINKNGDEVFIGTTKDLFVLTGLEETHHAACKQILSVKTNFNAGRMQAAQYNETNIEYLALKRKIRYAQDHHMPNETIGVLKKQLNDATTLRKKPIISGIS